MSVSRRVNACTSLLNMKTPRVDPDLLTYLDSGQLCTDLEEVIQAKYHAQIFNVLIPTLEAPEPR